MENLKIKKSIDIPAAKEHVWKVLLDEALMRIWYAEFSEGAHAVTDWKEGSKAIFKDNSENGMIARVLRNTPYEVIDVEYEGLLTPQGEDYESEAARQVKGGRETYLLTEQDGHTRLAVESDMSEEYFDSISKAWDRALEKISELAVSQKEGILEKPTN